MQNIIGHKKIRQELQHLLSSNKLPHAMIFSGPSGVGKRLVALELAELILSRSLADSDSLTEEKAISLIQEGNHPDLHLISTIENKKSIGIDTIRELQEKLALTPYYRTGSCIILEDAEKLTLQAANCLLKTLEEPMENRFFILLSSNAHLLPPTILSRVQKFLFGRLTNTEIGEVLDILFSGSLPTQTQTNLIPLLHGSLNLLSTSTNDRPYEPSKLNPEETNTTLGRVEEIIKLKKRFKAAFESQSSDNTFISEITHLFSSIEKDPNLDFQQGILALHSTLHSQLKKETKKTSKLLTAQNILKLSTLWEEIKSRNLNPNLQLTGLLSNFQN